MTKRDLLLQMQIKATRPELIDSLVARLSQRSDVESFAVAANDAYRAGEPIVDDWFYDQVLIAALKIANPESEFLQQVEPEPEEVFGKTVELPERMLSTNKAYSIGEIEKWCDDVIAESRKYGFSEVDTFFRVTPKLDGFAAYKSKSNELFTRGNGRQGTDISRALARGLRTEGDAGAPGPGEIVVSRAYFERFLSEKYENSRNVIAAVIKEGALDKEIQMAINDGAILFHKFSGLNGWIRNKADLIAEIEQIWEGNIAATIYDTDGLVIESMNEDVKRDMGSTNHHHRWQIAFKKNTEFHNIKVKGLTWQTGKSGKITPVVELEPTKVSGVTISRATGHHAGNVINNGIYEGATVRVCRSGQVIPYIESVVEPVFDLISHPANCPSCGSETEMRDDFLYCTNEESCPAQLERTLEFFFKTIGNCDGFGPKIIEQLCEAGTSSVVDIYNLIPEDYDRTSITPGVAANLMESIENSKRVQIEDWRFLAAFSIHNVGKGGCERLLKHHRIEDVFNLTVEEIVQIDGFAEKTANSLVNSLANVKSQVTTLLPLFNLKRTPIGGEKTALSPITGKTVVFTGSMVKGSRNDMESNAKSLGAKVGSSVSSKTDYLICGANVGKSKTDAAEKHGVKVLTEDEYLTMIAE